MPDDVSAQIIQLFGSGTPCKDVAEGLRLIKAFLQIRDPLLRDALVNFVERIAGKAAAL